MCGWCANRWFSHRSLEAQLFRCWPQCYVTLQDSLSHHSFLGYSHLWLWPPATDTVISGRYSLWKTLPLDPCVPAEWPETNWTKNEKQETEDEKCKAGWPNGLLRWKTCDGIQILKIAQETLHLVWIANNQQLIVILSQAYDKKGLKEEFTLPSESWSTHTHARILVADTYRYFTVTAMIAITSKHNTFSQYTHSPSSLFQPPVVIFSSAVTVKSSPLLTKEIFHYILFFSNRATYNWRDLQTSARYSKSWAESPQ